MTDPLPLRFLTSAAHVEQLPPSAVEVALAGRSNVGKSSLLNAISGSKALAKTSSKPGRTQLLNCFGLDGGGTLVDLPGYGYAATASKQMRQDWQRRMERYLLDREPLALALLLVDGEVGPTRLDIDMLIFLRVNDVPLQVVATKHDKVKSSARQKRKLELAERCACAPTDVLWVSARKGVGLDRLRALVRHTLTG